MSHVATIELQINDLEALAIAGEKLGLEFMEGQKTHKWYGRWVNDYSQDDAAFKHGIKPEDYGKCLHALRVKGNPQAYEVGVVKNPNGPGYVLLWDFWAGGHGLMEKIGENASLLKKEYAVAKATLEAKKRGYRVIERRVAGKVQLQLTK